jgi:hypothetical protein
MRYYNILIRTLLLGFIALGMSESAFGVGLAVETKIFQPVGGLITEIVRTGNPATSDISLNKTFISPPMSIVATSFASATFGTLKAHDRMTITILADFGGSGFATPAANSSATFDDFIRVPGVVFVSATEKLHANNVPLGAGDVVLQLDITGGGSRVECVLLAVGSCTTDRIRVGSGLSVHQFLGVRANPFSTVPISNGSFQAGTYSADYDFRDTGILETLQGFDGDGREIVSFSIIADSGFAYNTGPLPTNSINEPEAITLMAIGMVVIATRLRRLGGRESGSE